jgi:hypothetical protein
VEPAAAVSDDLVTHTAPEDGGRHNRQVADVIESPSLLEKPSISAGVVASLAPGTVLDNLGCLEVDGRTWCDVQPLGGGPHGYMAAEILKPAVSPDGRVAMGPDCSSLRAGQGDFDATGETPCAQYPGQPMIDCEFGVARSGGGYATVVVTRPDGMTGATYFGMGIPIGADTSQADGYPEFSATREADLNVIRVGGGALRDPGRGDTGGLTFYVHSALHRPTSQSAT